MGKPNRKSTDPQERMEWQLDQIRVNTLIVGVVAALALVGAVLALLGG